MMRKADEGMERKADVSTDVTEKSTDRTLAAIKSRTAALATTAVAGNAASNSAAALEGEKEAASDGKNKSESVGENVAAAGESASSKEFAPPPSAPPPIINLCNDREDDDGDTAPSVVDLCGDSDDEVTAPSDEVTAPPAPPATPSPYAKIGISDHTPVGTGVFTGRSRGGPQKQESPCGFFRRPVVSTQTSLAKRTSGNVPSFVR